MLIGKNYHNMGIIIGNVGVIFLVFFNDNLNLFLLLNINSLRFRGIHGLSVNYLFGTKFERSC